MEDGETSMPSSAMSNSSPGTPVPPKKKGRPRINTVPMASTPTPVVINQTTTIVTPVTSGSPKGRFPNNPVLKKKLLGLQRFLSEYTVRSKL